MTSASLSLHGGILNLINLFASNLCVSIPNDTSTAVSLETSLSFTKRMVLSFLILSSPNHSRFFVVNKICPTLSSFFPASDSNFLSQRLKHHGSQFHVCFRLFPPSLRKADFEGHVTKTRWSHLRLP